MSSPLETIAAAWDAPPKWVIVLAERCLQTSQNKAAKELGRSGAVVSQILHNKYPGDVDAFRTLVQNVLMNAKVPCPQLGEISATTCQEWQIKAAAFLNTNPRRLQMFKACNRCKLFRKANGNAK